MKNALLVITIFACINSYYCQDVTTCRTSRNEIGRCASIANCQPFIHVLRSTTKTQDDIEYIRLSTCPGTDGRYPLACCPNPNNQIARSVNSPFLQSPQCGVANVTSNQRVVGGVPAKLGEFPWLAALGYRNRRNANVPNWLCGGTLITNKHILTAAHCISPDLYMARLGDLDLYSNDDGASPEDYLISDKKAHEQFSASTRTNDIGILTLSRNVVFRPLIRPICLPVQEPLLSKDFTNDNSYVAGWGATYFNGPTSPSLQVVLLPVVPNQQCFDTYSTRAIIDDRQLCAGYAQGGKDSCNGDSGGPMMYESSNLVTYQIGIVSYGRGCAQPGMPGVYTRVTKYLQWIENNIQ